MIHQQTSYLGKLRWIQHLTNDIKVPGKRSRGRGYLFSFDHVIKPEIEGLVQNYCDYLMFYKKLQ